MILTKRFLTLNILLLLSRPVHAAKIFNEAWYQNCWCNKWGGIQEYKLKDGTRVDCLTKNYACEFDWARKWYEGFGQALWYAENTKKKPGLILIIEKKEDFKYYNRAKILCDKYGVTLWYMKSPFYYTDGKSVMSVFDNMLINNLYK